MRPLKIRLTSWESRRLRQLRDHAPSARIVKRAMCLLLSAGGESASAIGHLTGLSLDAISDIRRRWREQKVRSLTERKRCGRPARVTVEYRRELRRALRVGPLASGYVFTVWSIARLSRYLHQRTGIALGVTRLRQLVHAEDFVVARPKHTLRGIRNEREYRKAKRRLERLKKGRCKRTRPMSCGTPTPASSTSCRTWCAAGPSEDTSGP